VTTRRMSFVATFCVRYYYFELPINFWMDATMRRLIPTATALVLSMGAHPAVAGSRLDAAPNVDPELSPPGLEVRGLSRPPPDKPRGTRQTRRPPVTPGLRPVSPEVARQLDEARRAQMATSPATTRTAPAPLLPRAMPAMRVEPSPERVIGAFINLIAIVIRKANRR